MALEPLQSTGVLFEQWLKAGRAVRMISIEPGYLGRAQ